MVSVRPEMDQFGGDQGALHIVAWVLAQAYASYSEDNILCGSPESSSSFPIRHDSIMKNVSGPVLSVELQVLSEGILTIL